MLRRGRPRPPASPRPGRCARFSQLDGEAIHRARVVDDTVRLEGAHFTAAVESGQHVPADDLRITFDAAAIVAAGYDTTTPIVFTNSAEVGRVTPVAAERSQPGTTCCGSAPPERQRLQVQVRVQVQVQVQHARPGRGRL